MEQTQSDSCGIYISFISINVIIYRNLSLLYYNLRGFIPRKRMKQMFLKNVWYSLNTHQQIQCIKIGGGGKVIGFEMDKIRIFIESKTSEVVVKNCFSHKILQFAMIVAAIPPPSFSSAWTWDHNFSQTRLAAKFLENF